MICNWTVHMDAFVTGQYGLFEWPYSRLRNFLIVLLNWHEDYVLSNSVCNHAPD